MNFEIVAYDILKDAAARWTVRYQRTAPLPGSEDAEEFTDSYRLPQTPFEYTQSFIAKDGKPTVLFKTTIVLKAWQTRDGTFDREFGYYKVCSARMDERGNIQGYDLQGFILI